MKRYLPALPNLILTDYLEFRWYVSGEHRQTARLARVGKGGKLAPEKDGAEAVTDLLTAFLSHEAEPINTPRTCPSHGPANALHPGHDCDGL